MRKILLVLLSLALLGLVLYLLWGAEHGLPDPSTPPTETVVSDADTLQGQPESEAAGPQDRVQREELEVPDAGSTEAGDLYRIRVVHKETGEPIPGARVFYYESDYFVRYPPDPAVNYEVEARERGKTVLSDDRGIAFIPVAKKVQVVGRHEGLYGELILAAIPNRDSSSGCSAAKASGSGGGGWSSAPQRGAQPVLARYGDSIRGATR